MVHRLWRRICNEPCRSSFEERKNIKNVGQTISWSRVSFFKTILSEFPGNNFSQWAYDLMALSESEDGYEPTTVRANQKPTSALLNHINPTGAQTKNAYPPIRRDLIQSWPFSFGGSNRVWAVTSAVKLSVKPVAIETPSGHFLTRLIFQFIWP